MGLKGGPALGHAKTLLSTWKRDIRADVGVHQIECQYLLCFVVHQTERVHRPPGSTLSFDPTQRIGSWLSYQSGSLCSLVDNAYSPF